MLTSDRFYANMLCFSKTKAQQKTLQICQPLRDLFNVDAFFYSNISNDGRYLHVGTRPDILEDYLYSGQLITSPTLSRCHYTVTPAIKIWEPQGETEESLLPICRYFQRNGLVSGVSLTVYHKTGREIYYFGTSQMPNQGEDYWHHCVPALYEFIKFFSLEARDILQQSSEHQFMLPELIGESFYEKPGVDTCFSADQATIENNFRHLLREHLLLARGLTARERAIFEGCLCGKTSKQIATDLSISNRTVQNNLQQIKERFNCRSQREMLALFVGDGANAA